MIKTNTNRLAAARLPDFPAIFPLVLCLGKAAARKSLPCEATQTREKGGVALIPFDLAHWLVLVFYRLRSQGLKGLTAQLFRISRSG